MEFFHARLAQDLDLLGTVVSVDNLDNRGSVDENFRKRLFLLQEIARLMTPARAQIDIRVLATIRSRCPPGMLSRGRERGIQRPRRTSVMTMMMNRSSLMFRVFAVGEIQLSGHVDQMSEEHSFSVLMFFPLQYNVALD